jgi:hypothetical protein
MGLMVPLLKLHVNAPIQVSRADAIAKFRSFGDRAKTTSSPLETLAETKWIPVQ